MSDHHLLDEVILSVFYHSKSHNMKECVAICIGHHRVGPCYTDQFFEALSVEFGGSDMNRRLSTHVSDEWTWVTMLEQSIDHKRVASQDGLVQCQLLTTVDLRSLFLHDHVKNAEVKVARVL